MPDATPPLAPPLRTTHHTKERRCAGLKATCTIHLREFQVVSVKFSK